MAKKSILKIIFILVVVTALLTSLSGLAFASPVLQSDGAEENRGSDQGNTGDEANEDDQNTGANQGDSADNQNDDDTNGNSQNSGSNQGTGANQGAGVNQNNTALACAQTYTVQAGDSLSAIAARFYNNMQNFNTIVQATNNAVGTGGNFTTISDPNIIAPGQTLCIPAAPGTATANTGTGAAQGAVPAAITTSGNNANMSAQQAAFLASNTLQGMLIVENMSGGDMIFDLTQPSLGSVWIGPGQQAQFLLTVGQQQFGAHHPTGEFAVTPGTVQVTAGQVVRMSCFTNMCQIVPTSQSGQQQSGQIQQQGQQPDQIQQQGQQQNNGSGNDDGDNNGDDANRGDTGGGNTGEGNTGDGNTGGGNSGG